MLEHVSISHSNLKMRANFAVSLLHQIEHVTLFWHSQTWTFLPCPLKWKCRTKSNDVSKTQWKFSNVSPGSTKNSQIYLAACCRKPLCRRLSKFSWLQEGNIQISYVQDSPWLSWSASPLFAFWFAVAQAKPGLATILAIMHLWVAIKLGIYAQATTGWSPTSSNQYLHISCRRSAVQVAALSSATSEFQVKWSCLPC